jgi:ribosome-associated protein
MTSKEKLDIIVNAADELKAENIEVLDVHDKTSVADYFVVCSGTSDRHIAAIAEKVSERLFEHKEKPYRTDGDRTGWVLHDYGDVILHVMRDEQRQFYDLETLWKTMHPSTDLSPG